MFDTFPTRFGHHVLLKSLGRGAMGAVFLARPADPDSKIPSPMVIKVLHAEMMEEAMFVSRFRHEAEIAATVHSPHVARVYEVGEVDGTLYMAMQYIDGWPLVKVLAELAARKEKTTIQSAVNLSIGALRGLAALHQAKDTDGTPLGIVHRDISPNNIMVGEDGLARLIDLGLGRSRLQDWKTRTGAVLGTPGYMPPEQVLAEPVDQRSDLYAVAVVLWELLTFYRFINPGPLHQMLEQSASPYFRAPSTLRQEVPPSLDAVLGRALAPKPDDRYPTAEAFIQGLQSATQESGPDEVMHTLLGQLLPTDLSATRHEIKALMAQSVDISEPVEPGVLIATSPSSDADPSLAPRAQSVGQVYVQPAPKPSGLSTVARWIGGLALIIVVFVAGSFWGQKRNEPTRMLETLPARTEPKIPELDEGLQAVPGPEPTPAVDPPPPPPPPTPTTTSKPRPRRAARPPTPTAEPPPQVPPPADVVDPAARLQKLYRRVQAIEAAQPEGSAEVADARRLLIDISLLKTARMTEAQLPKIKALEAKAASLEDR